MPRPKLYTEEELAARRKARNAAYRETHREQIAKYQRERHVVLRAEHNERSRQWWRDNAERIATLRNTPENTEARRQYWAQWVTGSDRRVPPVSEYWPYDTSSPVIDKVNTLVPRWYAEDIRADICQELCMILLEGEVDTGYGLKLAQRNTRREYAVSAETLQESGWDIPLEVWI